MIMNCTRTLRKAPAAVGTQVLLDILMDLHVTFQYTLVFEPVQHKTQFVVTKSVLFNVTSI